MQTRIMMTFAVLLFAGTIASAQPETPAPQPKGPGPAARMHPRGEGAGMLPGRGPDHQFMKELQLTDQQKKEIGALRADMEKAMVKIHADIQSARIDLRELLMAEKPDRSAIEKKIKEISTFQNDGKMALVNHLFSVNAKLTPDQQKKFREHMAMRLMEEPGQMQWGRLGKMLRRHLGR
jgi:Spy/CpxP family protein refolding chaperone